MYLLNNNKNKTIGVIFRQTDIHLLLWLSNIPNLLYYPLSNEAQNKSNTLNKIKFFNTHHLPPKDTVFRRLQPCRLTSNGLQTYRLSKKNMFSANFFDKLKLQKNCTSWIITPVQSAACTRPSQYRVNPPFALPHSTMILFLCILSVLSPSP